MASPWRPPRASRGQRTAGTYARALVPTRTRSLGVQVLQQLCGINAIMYYAGSILQRAGFTDRSQVRAAVIT